MFPTKARDLLIPFTVKMKKYKISSFANGHDFQGLELSLSASFFFDS